MAFTDVGGWDTHVNEVGQKPTVGVLANNLTEFGGALAAFSKDLGDRMEDITVVTMSEFGRTAHENGNRGTDHGHANVMFVLGGPVKGGKVYGRWPGLQPGQLYEGRDLAVTTDFRQVLASPEEGARRRPCPRRPVWRDPRREVRAMVRGSPDRARRAEAAREADGGRQPS